MRKRIARAFKKNGNDAESAVHRAALWLLKRKEINFFVHAERCDSLDSAHIDFIICRKGKIVALQVKGCVKAARKHRARYPLIPVITVRNRSYHIRNTAKIAQSIMRIVEREFQSHEYILDEATVRIIQDRLKKEGYS